MMKNRHFSEPIFEHFFTKIAKIAFFAEIAKNA